MITTQHTTGKWEYSKQDSNMYSIYGSRSTPVAMVNPFNRDWLSGEEVEANAALICDAVNNTAGQGIDPNAVPGLLEALQDSNRQIQMMCERMPLDKLTSRDTEQISINARAIAAAKLK